MFALTLTGCTSQASNIGLAKEGDGEKQTDTGFTLTGVGNYDSADTAVVMSVDQDNRCVVFMNMDTGRQYTLYYDGATYIKDKYDGPMTISQIRAGDILDVNFLKGKRQIASMKMSPKAWVYNDIANYDLGGINKTASIGSTTYALPDDVAVFSQGKRVEVMDIVNQDVVTIGGIDHKIYSINVEKGHGYLRLKNDQALIGGWIEIGNAVIREITEDMLLIVPEGSYQVALSKGNISTTKEIVVDRDKEVVLDVGDVEIAEDKTGRILFSVTPETAKVSIDGKETSIEKAVELPYGIHQVHLEAEGYDSLTKYIQVGSEYASISFTLEESAEPEEEEDITETPETEKDKNNDESSVSENTITTKSGNKVYIDAPKNVEVYLDGNYIGMSPVSFKKVTGSHTITLRKSGYQSKSYTIYLYNDGEDVTYSFSDLIKTSNSVSDNSKEDIYKEADFEIISDNNIRYPFNILPSDVVIIDGGEDDDSEESGGSESGKTDGGEEAGGNGGSDNGKTDGGEEAGGNDSGKTDGGEGSGGNESGKTDGSEGNGGNESGKSDGSEGSGGSDGGKTGGGEEAGGSGNGKIGGGYGNVVIGGSEESGGVKTDGSKEVGSENSGNDAQ